MFMSVIKDSTPTSKLALFHTEINSNIRTIKFSQQVAKGEKSIWIVYKYMLLTRISLDHRAPSCIRKAITFLPLPF